MKKRNAIILMFLAMMTFGACTSENKNTTDEEEQQVEDMTKSDQERSDSLKNAMREQGLIE